jgi:hypothetical protein
MWRTRANDSGDEWRLQVGRLTDRKLGSFKTHFIRQRPVSGIVSPKPPEAAAGVGSPS